MPIRPIEFAQSEYYHICGRGHRKQIIFRNDDDYNKFLFSILAFQSPEHIPNIRRVIEKFSSGDFSFFDKINKKRKDVNLIAFTLMPNHYHLIVRENGNGNISSYMQRILTSHARYFNTKYGLSDHLFGGPFRSVHIEDNEQLLYTSAYIHNNPRELMGWKNKEHLYRWSSYQDYTNKNRWGEILNTQDISGQWKSSDEYLDYLKTSTAKNNIDLGF